MKGIIYMFIATFFFAFMNVLVKLLPGIPSVEIVFFRSLISFLITFVILKYKGIPLLGKNRKWLVARGTVGAIALVLYFYTLQKIPLASAVTIQFLAPIFTTIIGVFLLKEHVKWWQWLFFGISFAGVLMVQGFDTRIDPIYFYIGLIASIFAGFAYNIIRKIGINEHPLVIVFYFPLVTTPITGALSVYTWVTPKGMEWLLLLAIGIVVQIAQYFLTMSYQQEEVNKIAPIKYFSIIYALMFGWFIFDEGYDWIAYSGMILVIVGVLLNLWMKRGIGNRV